MNEQTNAQSNGVSSEPQASTSQFQDQKHQVNACKSTEIATCSFNCNVETDNNAPGISSTGTTVDMKNINVPLILLRQGIQAKQSSQLVTSHNTASNLKNPPSLFLQALARLSHTSIASSVLNNLKEPEDKEPAQRSELSAPDSLTSAPPSYSFVLRQMSAQRRPRLMGTFIPSPSFVQPVPPPNYAAAFDVYIDNTPPLALLQQRACPFSYISMNIICANCGYAGATVIRSKVTVWTHLCAIVLCLMCCWLCAPLPYILNSCKNVYHYCRNCRTLLGMYSPTHPENPQVLR